MTGGENKPLLENWPIKLTSFVLALSLWLYVTSTGKTEVSLAVPLELKNIPAGMVVVGDLPKSVDIRVHGQERLLRDAGSSKKIVGTIDLSGAKQGRNRIQMRPDSFRKPSGAAITHIGITDLSVFLDRLVRKAVELKPVVHGAPARGFRVASVAAVPPRITVSGPAGAMANVFTLPTMPIDVSGVSETFTVDRPQVDYQGRPLTVEESDFKIRITIRKEH